MTDKLEILLHKQLKEINNSRPELTETGNNEKWKMREKKSINIPLGRIEDAPLRSRPNILSKQEKMRKIRKNQMKK